jgi:1-acyl-sn-glycerol-3-phosphate acyltransferase
MGTSARIESGVVKAIRLAHSAVAWAVALPATAVLGSAAAVVGGGGDRALGIARAWARLLLAVSGCRLRVTGSDGAAGCGLAVVMANHQSSLDIPALLTALPAELRTAFWAKDSLFRVPFLGRAMRAMGFVPVDRSNRSSAVGVLQASLDLVRGGRSILVFPEETYGPPDGLLPFQRGGFVLALKSGLPILPVGIRGTREALPPDSRTVSPSRIEVRFGRPVATEGLGASARGDLVADVRRAIAELAAKQP